jgi:beta-lactamase regulating signal transducer with metallopeptidase domain
VIATMALPLVVSCLLCGTGSRLGRSVPPATAVRLLTAAAVLTALSTGFVLSVAAFLVVAQVPDVAALGGWSVPSLATGGPIQLLVGLTCGVLVLLLLMAATRRLILTGRDLARAAVVCHRLGPGTNGLIIVEDDQPDAYALPGLTGRVVISTAMLRALPACERRVVLAHEASHLRHRHHLYALLVDLGAAANPLMRPLATGVHDAIERWADEDAAAEVADRHLAARALARAGLARARAIPSPPLSGPRLAAADTNVTDRAKALLAPRPKPQRVLAAAITAVALTATAAAVSTATATERRFEVAQQQYRDGPPPPSDLRERPSECHRMTPLI